MCFSAEADIVAGAVLGAVGVASLHEASDAGERPLAAFPLLFAAHQLIEAVVWSSLGDGVPAAVGDAATLAYLAFAMCVLPVLVPLAVFRLEPSEHRRRRQAVAALGVLGAVIGVLYLSALLRGSYGAYVDGRHIAYTLGLEHSGVIDGIYVVICCSPLLLSSHRLLVAFGAVNAVAAPSIVWMTNTGGTSLWCAWAAITSVVILAYLRRAHGRQVVPQRGGWRMLSPG